MIHLTSVPTEQAASRLEHCSQRAQELQEAGNELPASVKGCYRHPDVKASILGETKEKYAYCESKMRHVHWGDVEHIYPKSMFPERFLDYDNLTLSCAICNNGKGNYYSVDAPILNPYEDVPEDHLVGLGTLLWDRNGSLKGRRTIELLKLNRIGLSEQREERLKSLSALVNRYVGEPDGPIKATLGAQIREETDASAEFALVARSFLLAAYGIIWHEI